LNEVGDFPQGLGGVYQQYFRRQFPDTTEYADDTRPALEVIAAAQEPLSLDAIAAVLGWSRHRAHTLRRSLGALFVDTERGIEPFHTSVMDWLTGDAGVYWADPQEGHARLAKHGWKQYREGPATMSNYAMAHLPVHLAYAGRYGDIEAFLSDAATVEACHRRKAISRLMAHLRILLNFPGRLARVSDAMLDAFASYDRDSFWQHVRGGLYQVFGDYDCWPQTWRKCAEEHPSYLVMRFVGDTLDMEERYEDAEEVFRRMLKTADPNCPEGVATAHIRLAYVLEHLDRPKEGLDLVEQLIAEPEAEERYGRNYRWAQHHQAICLRRLYRYREAKEVLEMIHSAGIRGEGLTTGPLHQLGIIDLELGRLDRAHVRFKRCRRLRGTDPWNRRRAYEYRRLGQVYALEGRFDQSRRAFERAVEISINCGDRRYLRHIRDDIVTFVDAPVSLLDDSPKTMLLADLPDTLCNNERLLPWTFRVLDRRKHGYLRVLHADSGDPTDDIARFDVAHQEGLWHAAVLVVIMDEHDNVLLQQRGEEHSYGKWDVSVAGHIGVGEDDVVAAIRETAEELGMIVAPDELLPVESSYQFRKEGRPQMMEEEGHIDPFSYVYRTDKFNRERISVFRVCVTAAHKREINGDGPRSALQAEWRPWTRVVAEARDHPERFASGLKQLLHTDILTKIFPCR
jgi:tetratricopeptide (TPR) repeat protein/8-oxo-dGTP pyrophosphatase MutT (NUDIX family)